MPRRKDPVETARDIFDEFLSKADPESVRPRALEPAKNPKAVKAGRLGGKKGGRSRAKTLTPEQRREIAKVAATARWRKSR